MGWDQGTVRSAEEGGTGGCSSRMHSFRTTSETKERTMVTTTQHLTTFSDEMVTVDPNLAWSSSERAAGREYSIIRSKNVLGVSEMIRNNTCPMDLLSEGRSGV